MVALALAVGLPTGDPPVGAATPAVSIAPAEVTVATGRSLTVGLQATAPAAGLGAWTIDVTYDPAVLSVTGCIPLADAASVCNPNYVVNTLRISGAAPVGLTGSPTLASLTFTAVGAAGTSSLLQPGVVTFADVSGTAAAATTAGGLVRVAAEVTGVGVKIEPAQITLAPAASATVSLVATAPVSGLGAWTVDLQYNPAVVTPTACVGANGFCNVAYTSTTVRFAGISAGGLTGTPSLGTVTFQAVGAGGTSTPLHPVLVTFTDPAYQLVAGSTGDGAVSIIARALSFFKTPPRAAHDTPFGIQPEVDVRENGALVDLAGAVTLSLSGGPPGAVLTCPGDDDPGSPGVQEALAGGRATFSGCRISLPGDYRLHAAVSASDIPAKTGDLFRVRWAGDADESCLVDIVDFSILLLTFGSTSDFRADFNGDNVVDIVDFSILLKGFGSRCPS